MRLAARNLRLRHGIWHLRVCVPKHLRPHFQKNEISRSLHTSDRRQASVLRHGYLSQVMELFSRVEKLLATRHHPLDLSCLGLEMPDFRFPQWRIQITQDDKTVELSTEPGNLEDHRLGLDALSVLLSKGDVTVAHGVGRAPSVHGNRKRLSELVETVFNEEKNRWSKATMIDYRGALNDFVKRLGDKYADEVSSQSIASYTQALRDCGTAQRTIDKRLNPIAALFKLAQRDGYYPPGIPLPTTGHFKFRKVTNAKTKGRGGFEFFDAADLKKIFDPANLSAARTPHEFFLPLLGLLTGARINELCQLALTDVRVDDDIGVAYLDINGDREDASVKTDSSPRWVPLHPKLVATGFLEYVAAVRKSPGATLVFPYLRYSEKNGYAGAPSKAFGRYLDKIGVVGAGKVFHSLRKTCNQRLLEGGVSVEIRSDYLGHENENVNSVVYTRGLQLKKLGEVVHPHLDFPEIDAAKLRPACDRLIQTIDQLMSKAKRDAAHEAAMKTRVKTRG
ncbi:phage integrase [Azoarcus sp. CIB]|uniref:site-specific integrase n=1 Tax=Aromatoleum sp. (strain CIB) TaxID=198107 RepID=UPI00067D379C|nr:site-specific integrase [Azoarcus sp. CIB]AKU11236.1 phage integrase [Azoarcus sp. CIB]